jgi:hypothetical protein
MSTDAASEAPQHSPRQRTLHRLALLQAVILLLFVVVALPVAFQSMGTLLFDRQARTLYEFPNGRPAAETDAQAVANSESFFNIAAIDLDEASGNVTLAISGHRNCGDSCTPLNMTLFSLENNASVRRALPPSAPLNSNEEQAIFSQTVQLPISGQPSMFPFDDYVLWLGLSGTVTVNGEEVPLTQRLLEGKAIFTVQNQLRDFLMDPPVEIDASRARAITDPFDFVGVQELHFKRPIHQGILAVLLVTLIAVSAIMAVSMRDVSDLIFGIGSLVLGIWGVRSVLVPSSTNVITSIDLALSLVILMVLLGLSLRAAGHFRKTSELPPIKMPVRKKAGGKGDSRFVWPRLCAF